MLADHIAQLAEDLEIPALKQGDTGAYLWPLASRRSVEIQEKDQQLTFYSLFAPVPKEALETFFTKALHGNLFGAGTQGAILGISKDDESLVLCREFPKELTYEEFKAELEMFLNIIDFWQFEANQPGEEI